MERTSVYGRQSSNKTKSISEQLAEGHEVIRANGWTHAGDYQDGRSASRFGTKVRGGWSRLLEDVDAHDLDVVVIWEASRGDRTPETWMAFLSLCRTRSVRIHVVADDHTYNLAIPRDWKVLANAGVDSAYETELLSIRTKRGHAGAAAEGKHAGGPTPFGYQRFYDPQTGKPAGQFPAVPASEVVRSIFKRVALGDTVLGIVNDLNASETPSAGSGGWDRAAIRRIVRNRAYIALRVHNGVEHKGTWEPIVTDELFFSANKALNQPGRKITRPGRQKHLLSYLGACGPCGGPLNFSDGYYRCLKGHVSVPKDVADHSISTVVVARLSQPDALEAFITSDDGSANRARGEAQRLRTRLDDFRLSAVRGETSPASLAAIERELIPLISAAEAKARQQAVPLVLREMLDGVQSEEDLWTRWNAATTVAKRAVIKALCEVRIGRGKPGRSNRSDYRRLGPSRWHGDALTWQERW